MPYTYDYFQKSVDYLKEKVDFTPEIAIILGSCLGPRRRSKTPSWWIIRTFPISLCPQ